MSTNKINGILRSALWNVYRNKCFYCQQELEFADIHIDHIIPEHFAEKTFELKQIKEDYGYPEDFSINALYNLVPAHSQCNMRKSGQLFDKNATTYYLQITRGKTFLIEKEINKIKARKNKGQLLAKLHAALDSNLIDVKELEKLTTAARLASFNSKEIKLNRGFEFMDAVYDSFYLDGDWSELYDKKILLNTDESGLELINDRGEPFIVSTLNEWQHAKSLGFYAANNYAIKMASNFTYLESFLDAMKAARMPKYSFISEPWISIDNLEFLSPSVIQDFEGKLKHYTHIGKSVADLIELGIVNRSFNEYFELVLDFDGVQTCLSEQFRADFNGDGFEDVFVKGWVKAVDGSMGFGFNTILTRHSEKQFLSPSQITEEKKEQFKLTFRTEMQGDQLILFIQNDGEDPIMDAVFFMDKLGKSAEESERSRHTVEVVFGTVPPKTCLDYKMDFGNDDGTFGFPLTSGEFTARDGKHYLIDNLNNTVQISNRSPFD